VDATLDELKDTSFYTHLDLAYGFCQARVRNQDVHKTAFQTLDGLMEWVAMPFGLCNNIATFQRMMNAILRDLLHKFVTAYLDDVCVFNRTYEEHLHQLRLVLQRFKEEGLKLRLKKCFFGLQEMEYLGYTISVGKKTVSTTKVGASQTGKCLRWRGRFALSCNSTTCTPDLFVISFSDNTAPRTDLLRKSLPLKVTLTHVCLEAFETLKLRLISAPCLILPEVSGRDVCRRYTCFDMGNCNNHQGGGLQVVSYWARKLNSAGHGNTYSAYDLEALAVC
jgi:hypothetical protein